MGGDARSLHSRQQLSESFGHANLLSTIRWESLAWLLELDTGILSMADVNDSATENGLPSVKVVLAVNLLEALWTDIKKEPMNM
jgi:hypothetical protein